MRDYGVRPQLIAAVLILPLLLPLVAGCQGDEVGADACLTNDEFFLREVWGPVLQPVCMTCHNAQGLARDSDLVLVPDSQPGFVQINMGTLETLARVEIEDTPLLLIKPTGGADHGGGEQIAPNSAEYLALQELIRRFDSPVNCGANVQTNFFTGVRLLDPAATLRKASIMLVGRLPTVEEENTVLSLGEPGVEAVLNEMMTEDAFYTWLRMTYNDLLLTDRYLGRSNAIDLIDSEEFPYAWWYTELEEGVDDPALIEAAERYTNQSVAREPLDLIAYVVRNDRQFSEILTANYRLVNPFSARVWGMDDLAFNDDLDPSEFREGQLYDQPMAGVLTSPMFLNRFPTTPTNRNRHRARYVYRLFLATDVLKLADRPLDPTQIEDFNPTLYNPACTVCHSVIDPVAGTFQNWDAEGSYDPPEDGWFPDMAQPGFSNSVLPFPERLNGLQWLAHQVVRDRRFSLSAVHTIYRALTGAEPLSPPNDRNNPQYDTLLAVYDAQRAHFEQIVDTFEAEGQNLKTVVREIVLGPYFRAYDLDARGLARVDQMQSMGMGRLLTPELLSRKIVAVTGYPWRASWDRRDYLLNDYLIFYGGINSDTVNERITEPNGVIANIGQRMAVEMACLAVSQDFAYPAEERILFPLVEPSYVPEDVNRFTIDEAVRAIQENIRYLHGHVLGEHLALSDPELMRTYELFYATWREGIEQLELDDDESEVSEWLPGACQATHEYWSEEEFPEDRQVRFDRNYTIRAWMAVMTYLLSDYRFLYE